MDHFQKEEKSLVMDSHWPSDNCVYLYDEKMLYVLCLQYYFKLHNMCYVGSVHFSPVSKMIQFSTWNKEKERSFLQCISLSQ